MVTTEERWCRWCSVSRLREAVGVLIVKRNGHEPTRTPLCRWHADHINGGSLRGTFVPFDDEPRAA